MIELGALAQWGAFGVMALVALGGALGMTTTMSMFRSAIFLMASFIGVAGLFILLLADLLGLLQVMMYVGGMLVMALFMLLFSGDPGGDMMASHMDLKGPERFFSLGLAHQASDGGDQDGHGDHDQDGHGDHDQDGHGDHDQDGHGDHDQDGHGDHDQDGHGDHGGGGHGDMSMFTSAKQAAMWLGATAAAGLTALLLLRPAWPEAGASPDPDASRRIGELLMGPYMIAFEGAGLLILLGIFGAVYVARPGRHPDPTDRAHIQAAVDEPPPEPDLDLLVPTTLDLRSLEEEDE